MFSMKGLIVDLPTRFGLFKLHYYQESETNKEHLALVMGDISHKYNVLTRIHSECLTADVFGSQRCDCGEQLDKSMRLIGEEGTGLLIYLRQEGRGIGLQDKLKAYQLQEHGYDTADANLMIGHDVDERDYGIAAYILNDLGIASIRLLTNNPKKVNDIKKFGIEIACVIPIQPTVNAFNRFYLETKVNRMGHTILLD